jgi:predicted NAD-dependent protein-ADP-ribosyltransferase YbiA (DUF1768 family)
MPEARFLKLEIDSGNNIKIDISEYVEWEVIADIRNQDWVGPKGYLYHPPDNNVASRESEVWRHLNSTDTKLEKALKKYERDKLKAMRKEYLERKKYGAAFRGGSGTGESYKTRYGEEVVADAEDPPPSGSPYDKRIDLEDPERGQVLSRSAKEAQDARKWMKENEKYIEPIDIYYSSGDNPTLSNLASRPFNFEDKKFLSVEHAYQTLKSGSFDKRTFNKYNDLPDVSGKKIRGLKPVNTEDDYNITLMHELIRESFLQNKEAQKDLLATGVSELTHHKGSGVWYREFPRILTAVREELSKDTKPKSLLGK